MVSSAQEWIANCNLLELQALAEAGQLSSRELTQHFSERISRLNGKLNAVIALDPNAVEVARELDAERSRSGPRSWLHGMPLLIKDNIETLDPLATTAGSLALRGNLVGRDAPVVQALREAGAIILGKANLSEWANFRSLRSSSGWSALGGQARNPHDTSRSVCGSSSGSAIAVAAGLAVAAVGTETDGSVICPASLCGVIGFKPAVGELSQAGIVPVAHSQDTAGPITGCVVDAAIMAAAMAGRDHSPLVSALAQGRPEDFLAGRRLGVVGANAGYGPPVEALFAATLDQLRRAGVVIVEDLVFARPKGLGRAMFEVLSCEFKHDLNAYLASLPGEFGRLRLRDLIVFNQSHAEEEMPHFGQELFELAESKPGIDDASYREALRFAQATTREGGIDQLIEEHSLDALITPSSVPAWPIDHAVGDPNAPASSSYPAVAGYPHITLPMGTVAGHPSKPPVQLPVGLSVFTQPSRRDSLFQIARGCELLAPARPQPML